jgi:hypothetical protein
MTTAPEQIKAWADKVEASSFDFARHGSYSPEGKAFWEAFEPQLSYNDHNAVAHELHRRMTVAAWAKAELPEVIKAHALAALAKDVRGVEHKPEPVDLSFLAERAKRTTNQFGKARKAYAPKGGCALKLQLKKAVRFTSRQEAYSDDTQFLVPVAGDLAQADLKACQENLSEFVRYADSHTGMAGSGSNWSASLQVSDLGPVVVIYCRSSIAD